MKNYSGIDEAGLGPILGPFCAASTTFSAPGNIKDLLQDIPKEVLYVDDSKKVYQGKYGLKRLEFNVLTFYALLYNGLPSDITEFIPSLNSDWNREVTISLPITLEKDQIMQNAEKVRTLFKQRGIELLDIKRTAVSPTDFNKLIDIWDNKSIVCQKIINPLLLNTLKHSSPHEIIIDKQGGRKFYKEYLDQLLDIEHTKIVKEENNHSSYNVNTKDIHFMAKADSNNFTVALSSMFSKYMRELAMLCFNRYWDKRLPNIKPTAGYYTDGLRFIKDLESAGLMPMNRDSLIRKK